MPFAFTVLLIRGKPERGMVSAVVSCPYFRCPLSASSGTCCSARSGRGEVSITTRVSATGSTLGYPRHPLDVVYPYTGDDLKQTKLLSHFFFNVMQHVEQYFARSTASEDRAGLGLAKTTSVFRTSKHVWLGDTLLNGSLFLPCPDNHQNLHKDWMAATRYSQRHEETCSYCSYRV